MYLFSPADPFRSIRLHHDIMSGTNARGVFSLFATLTVYMYPGHTHMNIRSVICLKLLLKRSVFLASCKHLYFAIVMELCTCIFKCARCKCMTVQLHALYMSDLLSTLTTLHNPSMLHSTDKMSRPLL